MNMERDARVWAAIDRILDIEHRTFGARLGLLEPSKRCVNTDLIKELVYSIDELSWSAQAMDQRLAVQLIALSWEHSSELQRGWLRGFLVGALARLGVGPSAAMLEKELDPNGEMSSLGSYMAELASAILQVEHRVSIGQKDYYLSKFQGDVLKASSNSQLIGISAPTSAGKSFAIYLSIVRRALTDNRCIIYIVPTISLMNQVSRDLRDYMDRHHLQDWMVLTGYAKSERKCIFVLTQERALPKEILINARSIGLLVVDEVQNLERFSDDADMRSKILFDALTEIYESSPGAQIILSGPRVKNINGISRSLFETIGVEIESGQSPVASITYGVSKNAGAAKFTQYTEFYPNGRSARIENAGLVVGTGKSRYSDDFLLYLSKLVSNLGPESRSIIFSPTSDQARKTARSLMSTAGAASGRLGTMRVELSRYISESVHPSYDLVDCVSRGVGFHSGKVPPHIRLVCEMAFTDGVIKDLACTTTLMQGVNLPANVVFARNPNLFIDKRGGQEGAKLSPYEFSNLRGRAGRLMKDFVGRTVVLDEGAFTSNDSQDELFPNPEKEIVPTFRQMFERNRMEIQADFDKPGVATGGAKFLCAHVRQSVLRYGSGTLKRLHDRGVDIDEGTLRKIGKELAKLEVSSDVCLANRYWDPFDLQVIKDNLRSADIAALPNEPWTIDSKDLAKLLMFQSVVSPYYFERYLGAKSSERLDTLAISAVEWARERPLSEMLKNIYSAHDVSASIDRRVSDIYKIVVYGVPSVLKPVADIMGSGHGLLASIESGVFSSVGRLLVEKGLYRDTAVQVRRRIMPQLDGDLDAVSGQALRLLKKDIRSLNYWVQRQVDPIVGQWERSL